MKYLASVLALITCLALSAGCGDDTDAVHDTGTTEDAAALTEDERIKLLSFTGSPKVGWMLKAKAGKKKVVLELGGNAACIIGEARKAGAELPYGCVKDSGLGREGIRYAMDDMTEIRSLILRDT